MDMDREAVVVATWVSFATLVLSAAGVACLNDHRVKPESNTECCRPSRKWAFVPLPSRWPMKTKHCVQSILLVVALVACICQVLVIMLQPNTSTLVMFTVYNFVNTGFVISYWAGEAFLAVQALSVGAGCVLMWTATALETYYAADRSDRDGDEAALLVLFMWILAACSVIDFTFYVAFVYCCFGEPAPSGLDDQLVRPVVGPASSNHDDTAYHMYTVESSDSSDNDSTK